MIACHIHAPIVTDWQEKYKGDLIMKRLISFNLRKPVTANYTPAGLMNEYAKAARIPSVASWHGGLGLEVNGSFFHYDHWRIDKNGDGTETVTVYLAEA